MNVVGVPPPQYPTSEISSEIPSSLLIPDKILLEGEVIIEEQINGDNISPRDYVKILNNVNHDLNLEVDDFGENTLPNCFQFHYLEVISYLL
jgi:hypothetical protein